MVRRWITRLIPSRELPLERQFFQGLCLLSGLLCLFVVAPANLIQNLSPWVNPAVITFGLLSLALNAAARRGHDLLRTYFFSLMACLDLIWFANGGSQGSIGLFFFPAALFAVVFFRGTLRWGVILLIPVNLIGLHLAEWTWPTLAHPFGHAWDRIIDLVVGYVLSLLGCVLMQWVILAGFNRERSRLHTSYRALKESEGKFARIFQGNPDALLILDQETGRILETNAGFERISGYTRQEVLGRSTMEVGLWKDPPEREQLMAMAATGARVQGFEALLVHKDGHTAWGEISLAPLEYGGRVCILSTTRDISSRRHLEEVVQQAQKMDSLGSLAGGVAHDFNNMLGGIMGYADLLLESEPDPRHQEYLRAILGAATRSGELTRKLLAFGRRGKNLLESVELDGAIRECLSMLRPSLPAGVQVELELEPGLRVDGDPAQVHQVLVNLCINAVDAMPERGTLTLTTRRYPLADSEAETLRLQAGDYLELKVIDTGVGMTEEVRKRICEPFFTTKTTGGTMGTGLGLSTVYGILQGHRGTLEVSSARGRGSTFRVLLPAGVLAPAPVSRESGPGRGEGLVLVVEDEPMLRELAASALESLGFEALSAANGREGAAIFLERHRELRAVLLDLKMPVLGGREAFLEIHHIDPDVPVVVCTGYGENEEVQELITLGAAGMLAKPYRIAELEGMMERLQRR